MTSFTIFLSIFGIIAGIYLLICLALYFFQDKLVFHPEKLPSDFVFSFKTKFEEHFFCPEANIQIHGLWFKKEKSKGVILYFHGNTGSLRKCAHLKMLIQ